MRSRNVILVSLALTALIFATGILINYGLDFLRVDTIQRTITDHELDAAGYRLQEAFAEAVGGNRCQAMQERIVKLKKEVRQVSTELAAYSRFSFFKKNDFDYLKRKYFLLELRFYALLEKLNRDCNTPYLPILFFYKIDDDMSERQGFILEDLSDAYRRNVVVLSFDKEYEDEPLVQLVAQRFGVTRAPTLIIDSRKYEGQVFLGELNATVLQWLQRADHAARDKDFLYTPRAAGANITRINALLQEQFVMADEFAKGDIMLVRGRLSGNDSLTCGALAHYDSALQGASLEEKAILLESIASLGCGRDRSAFLYLAADAWSAINVTWRAEALRALADGRFTPRIEPAHIEPALRVPENASSMILGKSVLRLRPGQRTLSQADRVTRDWLGGQISQSPKGDHVLVTFSERLSYAPRDLRPDIGWHEGSYVRALREAGMTNIPASGTLVARGPDGRWFATDEGGVFRFQVPRDKLLYPTTRFLRDDVAMIVDTHGANMLVEEALRHDVDAVISDCDNPGKTAAAAYLSDHGIPVVCLPDKYAYLALGHNISLYASAPLRFSNGTAIFGDRPLSIDLNEPIVVVNSTPDAYALWYYQTPASYFSTLSDAVGLNLSYVLFDDFRQMKRATERAALIGADVIAARVFNLADYDALGAWLGQAKNHRAVLFHTVSYPYGKLMYEDFPDQVTFGDVNPAFG